MNVTTELLRTKFTSRLKRKKHKKIEAGAARKNNSQERTREEDMRRINLAASHASVCKKSF